MKAINMTKIKEKMNTLLPGILTLGLLFVPPAAKADLTVTANHSSIDIGAFYHGSSVSVSGEYDAGSDLVVKISSPEGHSVLKKKGKVGGMLWMNVGDLKFDHQPNLYLLRSSAAIEQVVAPEQAEKYVLGYKALEQHVSIEPLENNDEKSSFFQEFIKFKTDSQLYSQEAEGISLSEEGGKNTYSVVIPWPYQAQPGDYTVEVYAVKDKTVVDTANTTVSVQQTGAVKLLADMARNNGALYGIVSILVALISGFGAGAIFKKGEGAH